MLTNLVDRVTAVLPRLQSTHLNISISLDGLAERHDANRKIRNGFNLAIENLRAMVAMSREHENFHPSVAIALTRGLCETADDGRSELHDLIALLRDDVGLADIGFDHIRSAETDVIGLAPEWCSGFTPPPTAEQQPDLKNRRHDDVQLSIEERRAVNDQLREQVGGRSSHLTMLRLDTQQEILEKRARVIDCLAGVVDCVIYPSGDVAVCEFSTPFANLADHDHDLPALMRAQAAKQARAATRRCACSHPCHLSDSLAYDTGFLRRFLSEP
jgi:MoaA/NifB/PqqE/SkfB family radical SAM enzyme